MGAMGAWIGRDVDGNWGWYEGGGVRATGWDSGGSGSNWDGGGEEDDSGEGDNKGMGGTG